MDNEYNMCIICYNNKAYLKLCEKCKYKYCNKCAYKINNHCSICYRKNKIIEISEIDYIDLFNNEYENIDVINQNIDFFIKLQICLSIILKYMTYSIVIYLIIYLIPIKTSF